MKIQYSKRDICNIYLKVIHTELLFQMKEKDFEKLDSKVRYQINSIVHKKFLIQKKKLRNLKSHQCYKKHNVNRHFSDHVFYPRFLNLTNTVFINEETKLLEKGFKFNLQLPNSKKDLEVLAVDCECTLNKFQNQQFFSTLNSEKYFVANKLKQLYVNHNNVKSAKFGSVCY